MSLTIFKSVVAGCGNCAYYALALRLVVALAAEPYSVRAAFAHHAQCINAAVLGNEETVKTTLAFGTQTSEGARCCW